MVSPGTELGRRRAARERAILHGVLSTVLVRGLTAVSSLVALGIAARSLDKAEFGVLATLVSLWLILMFADAGVGAALTTRLAEANARDDVEGMRHQINHACVALLCIGSTVAIGGAVAAFTLPWDRWLGGSTVPESAIAPSVLIVFLTGGVNLFAVVGMAVLNAHQRFATAQLRIACASVAALLACTLSAVAELPLLAFVLAFVGMPAVVSVAFTMRVLITEYPSLRPSRTAPDPGRIFQLMRSASSWTLITAGAAMLAASGILVVSSVLGPEQAALFGVASRLFTLLGSVVQAAGTQVWPVLTEAITRGDLAWARSQYTKSLWTVAAISALGCALLIVLGRPVARLWVGDALVPPLNLLVVYGLFTVTLTIAMQASVILAAIERLARMSYLFVATAAIGLAASVVLAKSVGITGPAIGSLLAAGLFAPGLALLTRRAWRDLRVTAASDVADPNSGARDVDELS